MPKLKLKITHTNAGVAYPAGHVIDVDEHTARWLTDHGIAEAATHHPEPAPAAPVAPVKTTNTSKE